MARRFLATLAALAGLPCARCAGELCGHERVLSVVMGFKQRPVCLSCLAGTLGRARGELRDQGLEHLQRRDCFRQGWLAASLEEQGEESLRPACLFSAAEPSAPPASASSEAPAGGRPARAPQARWDAGEMSCGELVLELRMRLRALDPGELFEVRALDLAAPIDLPAWCRLTRNRLAGSAHPLYWIEKRKDL